MKSINRKIELTSTGFIWIFSFRWFYFTSFIVKLMEKSHPVTKWIIMRSYLNEPESEYIGWEHTMVSFLLLDFIIIKWFLDKNEGTSK